MAAPFCVSWETMDNDGGEMKRRELREHIFQLLFRVEFNEKDEMAKQIGRASCRERVWKIWKRRQR